MERVKTATLTDVRNFFSEELRAVMSKHKVQAEAHSFGYLVDLLVKVIESDKFFAVNSNGKLEDCVLVDLYANYLQSNTEQKRIILQRIGDICLMISGFFAESLSRKLTDVEYYFGMGGTAYQTLSGMQASTPQKKMYFELSTKFQNFSNVLGEMGERSGLKSNSDLLRVYERWLVTGSDRLRTILSENGIAAASVNRQTKH